MKQNKMQDATQLALIALSRQSQPTPVKACPAAATPACNPCAALHLLGSAAPDRDAMPCRAPEGNRTISLLAADN